MARGVEKSLRAVILDARGTHEPEKNQFCGGSFFQLIFGVENLGWSHAGNTLKWPVEVREEVRREEELERK